LKHALWPLALLAILASLLAASARGTELPQEEGPPLGWQQAAATLTPRIYLPYVPQSRTPTPTPTPTPYPKWTGQYFNNTSLSGSPAVTREDANIDFDWGLGTPVAGVTADNFSVRWTRSVTLTAGDYNFFAYTDDGVRLWVDDAQVLDEWHDQQARQYVAALPLEAASHDLKMEYYEGTGAAVARLGWINTTAYPKQGEWGSWQGEYFDNRDLSGTPKLVRKDAQIDFTWGSGSPDASLPADNFSVRWTASLYLKGGSYHFFTYSDDGVRLYVDGALVIDQWHDQGATQWQSSIYLAEGTHFLRMEYYERTGEAVARLWWHNSTAYPQWMGEYFANASLSGSPILLRNDASINFDWPASPGDDIPSDRFSVRWTGVLDLTAGTYTFKTYTDDGVRLWVDGKLVIDEWHTQGPTEWTSALSLGAGLHFIRMEYFENTLGAVARLTWQKG
jgi:hypothetical protein